MDWIAAILGVIGAWLIGNKNKWGFILLLIGSVLWITVSFHTMVYGLLLANIPGLLINIRNFWTWHVTPQ